MYDNYNNVAYTSNIVIHTLGVSTFHFINLSPLIRCCKLFVHKDSCYFFPIVVSN